MSKVYCVGGFLAGKEVDNFGLKYAPVSLESPVNFNDLSLDDQRVTQKLEEMYHFYHIGACAINFYIWNDDPELKINLPTKYKNHEV